MVGPHYGRRTHTQVQVDTTQHSATETRMEGERKGSGRNYSGALAIRPELNLLQLSHSLHFSSPQSRQSHPQPCTENPPPLQSDWFAVRFVEAPHREPEDRRRKGARRSGDGHGRRAGAEAEGRRGGGAGAVGARPRHQNPPTRTHLSPAPLAPFPLPSSSLPVDCVAVANSSRACVLGFCSRRTRRCRPSMPAWARRLLGRARAWRRRRRRNRCSGWGSRAWPATWRRRRPWTRRGC